MSLLPKNHRMIPTGTQVYRSYYTWTIPALEDLRWIVERREGWRLTREAGGLPRLFPSFCFEHEWLRESLLNPHPSGKAPPGGREQLEGKPLFDLQRNRPLRTSTAIRRKRRDWIRSSPLRNMPPSSSIAAANHASHEKQSEPLRTYRSDIQIRSNALRYTKKRAKESQSRIHLVYVYTYARLSGRI